MSHPVIVGVDTTERAQDAVVLGRRLAEALGAELVIAHVFPYDVRTSRYASVAFERLLREDAEKSLISVLGDAAASARLVTVPDTSPARGLHRLAEHEDARLLVTASSHRGTVGRILLGDVAHQTLHGAPCAVAVAPRGYGAADAPTVSTIGVGFDDKAEAHAALQLGATIAGALHAKLHVLASAYVAPVSAYGAVATYDVAPIEKALHSKLHEQITHVLADQPVECHGEVTDKPAVDELLRLSKAVDLLVLGSRAFGPLSRLIAGSTAGSVVGHAACPVIVVPRGATEPKTDEETGVNPGRVAGAPEPALAGD